MSSSSNAGEGPLSSVPISVSLPGSGPGAGSSTSPAPGPELVAEDLFVGYGRRREAALGLRGLSARFAPGITGLVGPNGAGKTTFLRTACGLLPPSRGSLRVGGMEARKFVASRGIGFLPEIPPLPGYLTPREFLRGVAPGAPGLSRDTAGPAPPPPGEAAYPPGVVDGGADPFGIPGLALLLDRRMDTLSLGQKKKVALAAALSGNPTLLLLDEPTNGLDPLVVRELREVLRRLGGEGLTIVVSSHHLDELQRLAGALVFVSGGRVLGAWTRAEALEKHESFDALFENLFHGRRQ